MTPDELAARDPRVAALVAAAQSVRDMQAVHHSHHLARYVRKQSAAIAAMEETRNG